MPTREIYTRISHEFHAKLFCEICAKKTCKTFSQGVKGGCHWLNGLTNDGLTPI